MKTNTILLLIFLAFIFPVFRAKGQLKSKPLEIVLKRLLSHKVPEIPVATVALAANTYILLDARENEEYQVSHLPNAIHVGYKNFKQDALNQVSKDKPIVVYCSIGKRSENITQKLLEQGYKNVSNLYGGIFEWVNQGHTVYDSQNKKTANVHAYNWLWGRFLTRGNKVY